MLAFGTRLAQLILAREKHRVINRCAVADGETVNCVAKRSFVLGEIFFECDGTVKADHHRKIAGLQSGVEK